MNQLLKYLSLVAMIVTISNYIKPIHSQMEVCHWDCYLVGCDYYGDCDYDCYEVCDIWRGETDHASKPTVSHENHDLPLESLTRNKVSPAATAPAGNKKGVLMRIKAQNATGTVNSSRQLAIWNQCASSKGGRSLGRKSFPVGHGLF